MDDLLDDPPIHLTPMPAGDRRSYERLRRLPTMSLSPAEQRELRILHHIAVDQEWEASPRWGPRGSRFCIPTVRPEPGRPRGVTSARLARLIAVVASHRHHERPNQEQIAAELAGSGRHGPAPEGRVVRALLRATGWDWESFLAEYWKTR